MKGTLLAVLGFCLVLSCLALDCPGCQKHLCKSTESCKYGTTLDFCGCCTICYKGIGEECGGPWNVYGLCAHHLSCIRHSEPGDKNPINDFNRVGKCLALP